MKMNLKDICSKTLKAVLTKVSNVQIKVSQIVVLSAICVWCSVTLLIFENGTVELKKRIAYLERRERSLENQFLELKTSFKSDILREIENHEEGISFSLEDEKKDEELPVFNSNIEPNVQIPEYDESALEEYEESDPECPWYKEDINFEKFSKTTEHEKPLLNLRSDRFLFGVFPYGPNNQLRGFRDTVTLAIKTNRTIVLPYFFIHRSEKASSAANHGAHEVENEGMVRSYRKIDIFKLQKFIPIITFETFMNKCKEKLNAVFVARRRAIKENRQMSRIKTIERVENVTLVKQRFETGENPFYAPIYFNETWSDARGFINMPFMERKAPDVYYGGRDAPCAMWLNPYRSIDLVGKLKYWSNHRKNRASNVHSASSEQILSDDATLVAKVLDSTPRPGAIREVAAEFTNKIIGGSDYVALHWRYDKADWFKHCEKSKFKNKELEFDKCKELDEVATGTLMGRFDQFWFLANLTDHRIWNSNTLYIASPITQLKIILHMKRALVDRFNRRVFTTVDFLKFLREKYSGCDPKTLDNDLHDVLSLAEMELCSKSKVFVRSGGSSWSYNIEQERLAMLSSYNDTTNTFLISGDESDIDTFD